MFPAAGFFPFPSRALGQDGEDDKCGSEWPRPALPALVTSLSAATTHPAGSLGGGVGPGAGGLLAYDLHEDLLPVLAGLEAAAQGRALREGLQLLLQEALPAQVVGVGLEGGLALVRGLWGTQPVRRAGGCGPLALPRPRLVLLLGRCSQDGRPPASWDTYDSHSRGRFQAPKWCPVPRATSAPSAPVVCVPPSACKPAPAHPSRVSTSYLLQEAFLDTPRWAASALCKKPIERNLSLLFQWPNSG